MNFKTLLPATTLLLLLPSCGGCCQKVSSPCYRKACPTSVCSTPTYSQGSDVVIDQQTTTNPEAVEAQPLSDELEEVQEEDELDDTDEGTMSGASTDKEALDDESLEVEQE